MATKLHKPVVRHDVATNLVVTVAPEGLYLREPRRRTAFGPLPLGALYLQAVRATVDAKRAAKLAAKRAAGKNRKARVKRGKL